MTRPDVISVPNVGWDDRVRMFQHGSTVSSFAVVTERFLVIVDTGVSAAAMAEIMDLLAGEREGRAVLVINTHGDWDHVWGNALFLGPDAEPAPIVAHRLAAERMLAAAAAQVLEQHRAEDPERFASAGWATPTVLVEAETRIDGGDLTLQLVPTPGHTPDHLAIWIPEIRHLLAGDAAEAPIPWVDTPSTLPTLRRSLAQLAACDPEVVLYCHAPGRHDAGVIADNIAYFDELEARCRALRSKAGPEGLHWPLEAAITVLPEPGQLDFYRDAHSAACRAMLAWVAARP